MRTGGIRPREACAAFAAYLVLALAWLWPLPTAMGDHLLYAARTPLNHADLDLGVWSVAWATHALATDPWNVFDANSFHPAPLSLAYSEHYLGHVPAFAPTYVATGNPILAVNVAIVAMYGLSGLGMYLLARRFLPAPAAFFAGLLYAFHPTRLEHQGHFYLLATGYLPLAMYFTERWLDDARVRSAVWLAFALGLQLLCSFYLAYAATFAYGLYLVLALGRRRTALDRRRVAGLAIALVAASLPFLATSIPYVRLRAWGLIPDYARARVPGLAASVTREHVRAYVLGAGAGIVGSLLALVALLPPWRAQRFARGLGAALAALGLLLAFGPEIAVGPSRWPSPYAWLQTWLPGFAAVRSSVRLLVIAQAGLALLAALGLARIVGRRTGRIAWAGTVVAAAACWLTFPELPPVELHERPVGEDVPAAYRWLAAHGEGRPLLELPATGMTESARRMYSSHVHWLPLLQGYSAYAPDSSRYVQRLAFGLPSEAALDRVAETVDLGWILVHLDELGAPARRWRGTLPAGLEKAASFGDDLVVRVTRPVAVDPRARLFDPERTLGGVPLAPAGPECPGRIRLAKPLPAVVPAGGSFPVEVIVANEGTRAWPGLGFRPAHVVHLALCLAERGTSCPTPDVWVPLLADVPPGEEVRVRSLFRAPAYPGDFELEVGLGQPADGPLADCGVRPLDLPLRVAGPAGSEVR